MTAATGTKRLVSGCAKLALAGLLLAGTAAHAAPDCGTVPAEIRGQVTLPANCTYRQSIRITESNTTLDCQGSTFAGGGTGDEIGLVIDSKGEPLSGVVVRNCGFRDFPGHTIRVTWAAPDQRKGKDRDEIYRRSPSGVLLERLRVENSGKVGVYIDDYVTNVTLRDSEVRGASATAVYLEHSSRANKILNNRFIGNGFREGETGQREALAVDSSADNLIEGNLFQGNAAGAIFLYKNCGEHFSTRSTVLRWQHSDRNTIRGNRFFDEKIGVWLASRQSRNLKAWDCGDKPMEPTGTYYEDFADNNVVTDNLFCRTTTPVRNEGDDNTIVKNRIDRTARAAVVEPKTRRETLLGRPTRGTVSRDNAPTTCPLNP